MSDTEATGGNHGHGISAAGRTATIDKRFIKHGAIYATRTSECHKAQSIESSEEVFLWTLRYRISGMPEVVERFYSRMDRISKLSVMMPNVMDYGVDANGNAYMVTRLFKAGSIFKVSKEPKIAGRIFQDIVNIVAALHDCSVVLGDICDQSFFSGPEGKVYIAALLGSYDMVAEETAMLPPPNTLQYLSPEQKSGKGAEPATDIFALGVLGYRLLTEESLASKINDLDPALGITSIAPPPTVINPELASWVDDIIGKCLEMDPTKRFSSGGELYQAIRVARQSGISPKGPSNWSSRTLVIARNTKESLVKASARDSDLVKRARIEVVKKEGAQALAERVEKQKTAGLMLIGLLLGVIVGGVMYVMFDSGVEPYVDNESLVKQAIELPTGLKESFLNVLTASSAEVKLKSLDKFADNEDPLVLAKLLSIATGSKDTKIAMASKRKIVERIRRQGLNNAADIVAELFLAEQASDDGNASPALLKNIIKAVDLSLPVVSRADAVKKVIKVRREFGEDLLLALSFDEKRPQFVNVLRQTVFGQGNEGALPKGLGPIVFSSDRLLKKFGKKTISTISDFSANELAWSLKYLAERNSPLLADVVKETVSRNVVPPFQAVFLKELQTGDGFGLTKRQKISLIHGALGKITMADISVIGRWYNIGAERALTALCAIAKDKEVALAAFDTLAARSLAMEPGKTLMTWMRHSFWDHRRRLIKAYGILGHTDISTKQQIEYAIDTLVGISGSAELAELMEKAARPELLKLVIDRMGEVMSSPDLINLLYHPNKDVRISAIRALKDRNDLFVLKDITGACYKEKDTEVKEEYRKNHWVVRDCR